MSFPLLRFPTPTRSPSPVPAPSPPPAVPAARLYIGNLHPTVSEHSLLTLFSPFGRIAKLDFLFHKAGPLRGRPRGYAFVEYVKEEDAVRAVRVVNGKMVRGRKLVVGYAMQDAGAGGSGPARRKQMESGKTTALSMIKAARTERTRDKIAMMEAKLDQMQTANTPAHPSLPQKPIQIQGALPISTARLSSSSLPAKPSGSSLPAKPSTANLSTSTRTRPASSSLPISAQSSIIPPRSTAPANVGLLPPRPPVLPPTLPSVPSTVPPRPASRQKSSITGVRIIKKAK